MDDWLKTADAATLAGVGTSTIKRWTDEGRLRCSRTPGGHRRYRRGDLDAIIADESNDVGGVWAMRLLTATPTELEAELMLAHRRARTWHAVASELGAGIAEVGRLWSEGQISITDEHRATERLHRVLANLSERILAPGHATAALVNAPEDPHTLGLSLVEICLREQGFDVLWLGARTPVAAVMELLESADVDLLCVSASASATDPESLRAVANTLSKACRGHGTILVLGGSGQWPEVDGARRFESWAQFASLASEIAQSERA